MKEKGKENVVMATNDSEGNCKTNLRIGFGQPRVMPEEVIRMGPIASAKKRKHRRLMSESMRDIMASSMPKDGSYEYIYNKLVEIGIQKPTVADAVAMGQAIKAIQKMDTDAAKFVRDTSGERPADIKAVTISGSISSDLSALSTEALESRLESIVESTGVVLEDQDG